MNKKYEVQIYSDINDCELRDSWKILETNSKISIFQSYDWILHWYKYIGSKHLKILPNIIVVKKYNKPIIILPFGLKKILKLFKILVWLGQPFNDLNCPLVDNSFTGFNDDILKKKISEAIYNIDFDIITLFNNVDVSILINCIAFHQNKKNLSHKINLNYIKNFDNYKTLIKLNNQSSVMLCLNKMKKSGNLEFKSFHSDDKFSNRIKYFVLENKKKQCERTKSWNYFSINTYENYFLNLDQLSETIFECLLYNNSIIAAHVGFLYKNIHYHIFPTYDYNYKKFSPGKILLINQIDNDFKKKIELFDFTIGDEDYKIRFKTDSLSLINLFYYKNFNGLVLFFFYKFYDLLKKSILKNFIKKIYHQFKK